jgi:hypothetical protein
MRKIFKYAPSQMTIGDGVFKCTVSALAEAEVLTVAVDPTGTICAWLLVEDVVSKTEDYVFFIVGTGRPIPEAARVYKTTFQAGPYVWHVFLP